MITTQPNYETYDGATVSIVDARADNCGSDDHRAGLVVPMSPSRAGIPVRTDNGIELDQRLRPN